MKADTKKSCRCLRAEAQENAKRARLETGRAHQAANRAWRAAGRAQQSRHGLGKVRVELADRESGQLVEQ